jgi:hypothetical protein
MFVHYRVFGNAPQPRVPSNKVYGSGRAAADVPLLDAEVGEGVGSES